LLLGLAACTKPAPPPVALAGTAYVGPSTLNLRKDLGARSSVAATAKHGDKLEVLETRRRFVHVRTPAGVEGWTDFNLLLSEQQMDDLRVLAEAAKKLPSQGAATVYEALNIHAEPFRQSPSFFQIPEGVQVDVIGHRLSPHNPPPAPKPVRVRKTAASKKKARSKASEFLLPLPAPPLVPANLEALSRPHVTELEDYQSPQVAAASVGDDWSLVRTRKGDVGWALSRMLVMAIPDEVAQYAEGKRITSYMPLGQVEDKEKNVTKQYWLWTTASAGHVPYEFDSFRVFVWSLKHHRYETAYIERNVRGYYPVETVASSSGDRAFSLVLEDKDGQLYKRTYAFSGYRVQMVSKAPYHPPPPLPEVRATGSFEPEPAPAPELVSWRDRLQEWRKKWTR
jgi:hypothetical protein